MKSVSLLPTSAKTVNSLDSELISSRLTSGSSAIVPSEISTWREPELAQPRDQAIDATLADRELGERPAEHHGDAVVGVARELGLEVGAHERRAPAELDDVDDLPGDLEQPVDVGERHPAIDHVGDAVLARLDRAGGDVEKRRYGLVVALSAPTTTTTFAVPASADTPDSSGWTVCTPSVLRHGFGFGPVPARVLDHRDLVGARRATARARPPASSRAAAGSPRRGARAPPFRCR